MFDVDEQVDIARTLSRLNNDVGAAGQGPGSVAAVAQKLHRLVH